MNSSSTDPAKPRRAVDKSSRATRESDRQEVQHRFCNLPEVPERVLPSTVDPLRASLILLYGNKWANGTVLRYYFFDEHDDYQEVLLENGEFEKRTWTADQPQKDVVREAFKAWKALGIGLEFKEVNSRDEAEIRIGFMQGDGSWSYIGRQILEIGRDDRTMNFGWSLTAPGGMDTALHEIGHTLGFPHEHQNPNSGIVWDKDAVVDALSQPPNSWDEATIYYNVLRKLDPGLVRGSDWDADSIMHYPFGPGLILEPKGYRAGGLYPAPGLSDRDKVWVQAFYPPLAQNQETRLEPFKSVSLVLMPGGQKNFVIQPTATRDYTFQTFGKSDTVMVLFEHIGDDLRFHTGDDDSGEDRNASIRRKLFKDRSYVLRIRLYHQDRANETAVMMS